MQADATSLKTLPPSTNCGACSTPPLTSAPLPARPLLTLCSAPDNWPPLMASVLPAPTRPSARFTIRFGPAPRWFALNASAPASHSSASPAGDLHRAQLGDVHRVGVAAARRDVGELALRSGTPKDTSPMEFCGAASPKAA